MGNGAVGASVHTPDDALYLLISRVDLWNGNNTMGAMGAVRIQGNAGLFTGATAVKQQCDLYRAQVRVALDTETGPLTFTLTCLRGQDVLLVDIVDERRCATLLPSRWKTGMRGNGLRPTASAAWPASM